MLTISVDYGLGFRSNALFSFLGEGIFTQDGHRWKHSRELLRRPFVRIQYQNLRGFTEQVNDLISNMKAASGCVVDLQPFFFRFTLATTTALIFGQTVKSFETEEQTSFANSFDYASAIAAVRLRLDALYWIYTPARYRKACETVKDYAMGFVEQALVDKMEDDQVTETKYAFIQDLHDELQNPILVRDQICNVLIAGRDTTACLLSWTL